MTPGQIASYKAACAEYGSPAERVEARFKAEMPADIVICKYDVDGDTHINAQLDFGWYADSSARLRRIAELFGLEYVESTSKYTPGRIELISAGVIDGVNVRFWDNVPVRTPKPRRIPSCTCDCHTAGGAS